MSECVIDASALLALVLGERGAEVVDNYLDEDALVSSVNLSEVIARLLDLGFTEAQAEGSINALPCQTVEFSEQTAWYAGFLRPATRHAGLSLGDRACLALAIERQLPVLTADRLWRDLDLGVEIVLIR